MYRKVMLVLFLASISASVCAQRVSISTDALKLVTLSPNIGFDIILSAKMSLSMEAVFNSFGEVYKGLNLNQITVSPELRYWFKRPLYSHYLGINILASTYDLTVNNYRTKSQVIGIGLGYGYSFILNKRISITPSVGIGYGYVISDTNPELGAESPIEKGYKPMITRFGVSFAYILN